MTGTLAQLIALTAYGNDYIRTGKAPADFDTANTTFRFCSRVDFKGFKKPLFSSQLREYVVAGKPTEWFRYLRADSCMYLRLYYQSSKDQTMANDHKMAGFVGGGGTWLIEAIYKNYSNYWANRWEVGDKDAADQKVWTVSYGLTAPKQHTTNRQFDNQKIRDKLRQTLTRISTFANSKDLSFWSERFFDKARSVLDSGTPSDGFYHYDLVPLENYPLAAQQLLFAAGSAWVFGGMGSWNDLGFDSSEINAEYERLSGELYAGINEAVIAAVNTY